MHPKCVLQISAAISEVLKAKLKVEPSRFYLQVTTAVRVFALYSKRLRHIIPMCCHVYYGQVRVQCQGSEGPQQWQGPWACRCFHTGLHTAGTTSGIPPVQGLQHLLANLLAAPGASYNSSSQAGPSGGHQASDLHQSTPAVHLVLQGVGTVHCDNTTHA